MRAEELRKLALALPNAHEEPHFERTSFRVGKKIFATMSADGGEAMVRVAPREKVEALLGSHPEVFFSYGYWTEKSGALGVHLARAKKVLISELLTAAHAAVAPKPRSARARKKS